jgi:predicted O-methyltransferase YrrM
MRPNGNLKDLIKKRIAYSGDRATALLRDYISKHGIHGWPYCAPDEGDMLYRFACNFEGGDALEVGMATGSTAGYLLAGIGPGTVTSIDYNQDNHERSGERLVDELGFSDRHHLIEENSSKVLPKLWSECKRYDVIFLDGWKGFDHMWVDVFYCAKMLKKGGFIAFDDARMPAVRKCISILEKYYGFERVDTYRFCGGWKQRLWHLLSSRSLRSPYAALTKHVEIENTAAGMKFDFWRGF